MKIDQSAGSATPLPLTKTGSTSAAGTAAAERLKGAAAGSGRVHRLASPASSGDFDAVRVAAIREDIRAGRYQIHTERIADGLLASVRDLLERGKKP